MAGFLGYNPNKEGPGVDKVSKKQKRRWVTFFEIYGRNFWKLITAGLLYFVSILPVVTIGPATAGFTYLLRQYANQEHAFMWHDYIRVAKKNLKQSLAIFLLNTVVIACLFFAYPFYSDLFFRLQDSWAIIPLCGCVIVTILFVLMNFYIHVMMITFRLSVWQLIKNSFLLAFLGVKTNLITLIVSAVIMFATYLLMPISLIFLPFIIVPFLGLLILYNVWPNLEKYLIEPYYKDHPEERPDQGEEAPIFEDRGSQKPEEPNEPPKA